ncbi:MAG TPA: 3-oxoacyl-ACP reductase family protein [Anaerolineales bacterium]|nr:3-oxoacyl-ACP reductase family protein [Anaerolineales bacterium]
MLISKHTPRQNEHVNAAFLRRPPCPATSGGSGRRVFCPPGQVGMTGQFAGQVVLVTGASRGIGQATAIAFAREGAHVVVNYRSDEAGAQKTLADIQAAGGRAAALPADVGQAAQIEQLVEQVEREIGPIHVLVNNAAAFNRKTFLDVTLADLDEVWATNVRGLFYLSQLTATRMAARRQGCIIHLSSILAQLAVPSRTAYCAAKGAVESLTRAMALDLAPRRVRVNAVSPGLIRTEALLAGMSDPERQAAVQEYIPEGRFGEAEEVAQAILFLASDAARYINGVVLSVDGGLGAREAVPHPPGPPPR